MIDIILFGLESLIMLILYDTWLDRHNRSDILPDVICLLSLAALIGICF